MGATIGAFLKGVQGTLGEALEKKHQEAEDIKKQKRDFYLKGAMNPEATGAQQQEAWDQYQKLSGPDAKKGLQKVLPLIQRFTQRGQQGEQAPQQGAPVPPPNAQGAPPQQSAQPQGGPPAQPQ